jgi:prevent-host-death family protein
VTAINLHEAKAHLGKYLARVAKGEIIVLCERNRPVAELRPIPHPENGKPLRLGTLKGTVKVPEDFNAPLASFERDFYSGDS